MNDAAEARMRGRWWLPGKKARSLGGELTHTASEGITLTVDGSFPPPPRQPPRITAPHDYDVILGVTDSGREVTLLRVIESSSRSTQQGRTSQTLVSDRGLLGRHVERLDDVRFGSVELRFAHLSRWAREVTAIERANGFRWRSALAAQTPRVVIPGATVHLSLRSEGTSSTREETLREIIAFAYQPESPIDLKELEDRVWRPFQDLMTLVALESSPLVGLRVCLAGEKPAALMDPWCEVLVSGHTVGIGDETTRRHGGFLFGLIQYPGGFEKLVPAWLSLFSEFTMPVSLFLASDYAPFTYVERRFAEAVQAVEGYHRTKQRSVVPREHKDRINRILAAVPPGDRKWLGGKLQNSHEPSLLERLNDVIVEAGRPFKPILAAWPDLTQAIRDTRNAQTHVIERKDKRITDPARLADAIDILRWMLRACFLRRLRLDAGTADGLIDGNLEFQWVRRRA